MSDYPINLHKQKQVHLCFASTYTRSTKMYFFACGPEIAFVFSTQMVS